MHEIDELEKTCCLEKSVGPCVENLDKALQELGVERQAYHGKSFVGNDVNKMLKVYFS